MNQKSSYRPSGVVFQTCVSCNWIVPAAERHYTCPRCSEILPKVCNACGRNIVDEAKKHRRYCDSCIARRAKIRAKRSSSKVKQLLDAVIVNNLTDVWECYKKATPTTSCLITEACRYVEHKHKGCALCGEDIEVYSPIVKHKDGGCTNKLNVIPLCIACDDIFHSHPNPLIACCWRLPTSSATEDMFIKLQGVMGLEQTNVTK